MPFVTIAARGQIRTTGPNQQVKIGRSSTTTAEYDVKNCRINTRFANQDKTGSFANGYEDSEVGVIGFDVSFEVINHADDPVLFNAVNNLYYIERLMYGGRAFTGYFRVDSDDDNAVQNADHSISISGKSCIGIEGAERVYPVYEAYVPA